MIVSYGLQDFDVVSSYEVLVTGTGFLTVVFRLEFDNSAYTQSRSQSSESSNDSEYALPVTAEAFNDAFPFYLLLDRALVVQSAGVTLLEIAPDIANRPLVQVAKLCKPFIKVTWDQVCTALSVFLCLF